MKGYLEGLYEAANGGIDWDTGKIKFDEEKLRRELDKNDRLLRSNKEIFEQHEQKTFTCPMYNPCPICYKCMNKASHLHVKCQTCQIPTCAHTHSDRTRMIKRRNFVQYVSKEVMAEIESIDQRITGGESNGEQ